MAAAVALAVTLIRPDATGTDVSVEEAGSVSVQVALPGLGSGAPLALASLHGLQPAFDVTSAAAIYQHDPSSTVTAARYASHLAADFVHFSNETVQPLLSAEQIQAVLTFAAAPELLRDTGPVFATDLSDETVLSAWLELPPGSALPPYFGYEVQRGDSVAKLAARFGLETSSILNNNWEILDPDHLEPGGQLTIPTTDGIVYTVNLGDTLTEIIENFEADLEATVAYPGNDLASAHSLIEGSTILLVGGTASQTLGFGSGPVYAIPEFVWPIGGVVTDFFGSPRGNSFGYHTGVDFAAPVGTFVGSAAPGVVVQAGPAGSFGLNVLVDHGGGVVTRYAHLSHIDVFLGKYVDAGSLIGFVGSTGYSTGAHLHFEIIMNGVPVDPLPWLN